MMESPSTTRWMFALHGTTVVLLAVGAVAAPALILLAVLGVAWALRATGWATGPSRGARYARPR